MKIGLPDSRWSPLLIALTLAILSGCLQLDYIQYDPALPGEEIRIIGNGFGDREPADQVLYDGEPIEIVSWANTEITALLPAEKPEGIYPVQVVHQTEATRSILHTISSDIPFGMSGFTVTANANNILSAIVTFETRFPAWPSVEVDEGVSDAWTVPATGILTPSPGTFHQVAVIGLHAEVPCTITATATDGETIVRESGVFMPEPLPGTFPPIEITVKNSEEMEPGLTLFAANRVTGLLEEGAIYAVDAQGEIVWYHDPGGGVILPVTRLEDGNFIYLWEDSILRLDSAIVEIDILGNMVNRWTPEDLGVDAFHHDVIELPNGNLMTLSPEMRGISGYPGHNTYNVVGDMIVEFDRDGRTVDRFSLFDVLDPYRIPSRESFDYPYWSFLYGSTVKDWTHSNAVVFDPADGAVIVSCRHQDLVFKVDRASGELLWVIGEDLPDTAGDDAWPFLPLAGEGLLPSHQHAPMLLPDGNLILYDNGNTRLEPFSRAVEYALDFNVMQIAQAWEWIDPDYEPPLYAYFLGDADLLPGGTVLVADAGIKNESPIQLWMHFVEVTQRDNEKVWEMTIRDSNAYIGFSGYNAQRIGSLYPPAKQD